MRARMLGKYSRLWMLACPSKKAHRAAEKRQWRREEWG